MLYDGFSQYYVRTALSNEIGIEIPDNAEITKVIFKRVFDTSEYKVIYLEKGERKLVEGYVDADGIQLDQYMKENAKGNDLIVFVIVFIMVMIQLIIPIFFLKKLIREIKSISE